MDDAHAVAERGEGRGASAHACADDSDAGSEFFGRERSGEEGCEERSSMQMLHLRYDST